MAMAAGLLGGLGAAGGAGGFGLFGSILSAFGSLIGGGNTPDVPMPAPIVMAPAQAVPEIKDPTPAATLLTQEDRTQIELNDKRRKLIASQTKSDRTNNITQGGATDAILDKSVVLGGVS